MPLWSRSRRARDIPSYGLLLPVARVMTVSAAEEVRALLDAVGIRSTTAPCPRGRLRAGRHRWRIQVLVFRKDFARARKVLIRWTRSVKSP